MNTKIRCTITIFNILLKNKKKKKNKRLLCECDIYTSIYDNDPQMKAVMENYNRQTSDRFKEYDERMKTTRQKCKDKYDKEIQNIILKDKIEKQMAQQLTTLETKITTEDIPTCICEKSLADKTEKFCLNCSKNMGAIAPWWGLVCGTGYAGWSHYVATTVAEAATNAGMKVVSFGLETLGAEKLIPVMCEKISSIDYFTKVANLTDVIYKELEAFCTATPSSTGANQTMVTNICTFVKNGRAGVVSAEQLVSKAVKEFAKKATDTAKAAKKIEAAKYTSTTSSLTNTIISSIIAIVIIVLIMVIIYLILRYRRKKKMKKKLQYIKLLEE
ncbi:hypothetical protein PFMALIP_02295 [Plasmodium falciparum MaliPS096_E11]|uniref:Surface antigen n=1 Tax=Plasmodium falciparum MaliPS096_E11 TaxID=1036727 RepID=A0A024WQX3_PLAFA|nr:hypothetical protein PFMALIP_02295 [Plasmodium falciparum MaliPS096_E11]